MYNGVKLSNDLNDSKSENKNHVDLYSWQLRANHFPLYKQLQTSRKILTTHDWMLARDELKSVKTIQRIEALKKKNLWSLKQLKRHKAAPRAKTHWDSMLDEMKWMQTDFKEERKWKMAMAFMTVRAVMEWHNAEDKSTVCVKTRIPAPITPLPSPEAIDERMELYTTDLDNELDADNLQQPSLVEESIGPQLVEEPEVLNAEVDSPLKADTMMGTDTIDPILSIDMMNDIEANSTFNSIDTADESSMPSTPKLTVESLSSEVIQQYRSIIKDLDPNMPILTLSIENFGEFDANALFPDVLTYEPPNPVFNDTYFDELEYGKITPISKLALQHITLKAPQRLNRKRDINGNPIIYYDETKSHKPKIKQLPRHERYDPTPLISRK